VSGLRYTCLAQTPPTGPLVFASADFDGLELRTMAQACLLLLGRSELARVLNAGRDPHLMMAANMLGMSYEAAEEGHALEKQARSEAFEFFKGKRPDATGRFIPYPLQDAEASKRATDCVPTPIDDGRQAGKVANFGFAGGLGAEKLVLFARKTYKVHLTLEGAKGLKKVWLRTFPEFKDYFAYFSRLVENGGAHGATFRSFFSGRLRGGMNYSAACNNPFQSLGADAAGNCLFEISEACYVPTACRGCNGQGIDPDIGLRGPRHANDNGDCPWCHGTGISALYGTRLVNYIHDDFMIECPEARAHEVAHELVRIMIAASAPYLPDVPATAKPIVSRFWSKDAKQVWIEDELSAIRDKKTGKGKRLVPWPKAA
jgi:hypothetical protein